MDSNVRDNARKDYEAGMSCAEISEKYGLKPATVRQWAKRHWNGVTPVKRDSKKRDKRDSVTRPAAKPVDVDKIIADAVEENDVLTYKQMDFCRFFMKNKNATQAYLKAYGCTHSTAMVEGYRSLRNPKIKAELSRLREIRDAALGLDGNDVIELHMRIAFSDITDFVEFENKSAPVLKNGEIVLTFDPDTGDAKELHRNINEVRLKNSREVDGNLITEVSEGREGVKIKLADRQKSLAFLAQYFELNPMDRHKKDYDNRRLALDEKDGGEISEETLLNRDYIKASENLWLYCKLKAPDFYTDDARYLREICQALQEFEYDDNELLVINIAPRHGKTRTANLASEWYLGREKRRKLISASYNEKLSRRSSKAVRDNIAEIKASKDRAVFSDVFPGVGLAKGSATVDLWRLDGNQEDNYLSTSPGATMTGFGADIIIIDDFIRNAYEANHAQRLEDHFTWFTDTLMSRLEGLRKIALIMTRWATKDLCGRAISLYQEQGRKIRIISKKAYDGYRMLNERQLNKKAYDNLMQTMGEDIAKANYDQEPIDLKGRLYKEFVTYTEKLPFKAVRAFCDIADKGKDYICNGIYGITYGEDPDAYMLDVLYTQEDMDATEDRIVQRLIDFDVEEFRCEENFGGRAWAKVLEGKYKAKGGKKCRFFTFHQDLNKEAKILACASTVTRKIFMPKPWGQLWRQFYTAVTEYQRAGKNAHDDGPDMLSEVSMRLSKQGGFVTLRGRV